MRRRDRVCKLIRVGISSMVIYASARHGSHDNDGSSVIFIARRARARGVGHDSRSREFTPRQCKSAVSPFHFLDIKM